MFFFFSSRRRHTRCGRDWSSDVCSSDLGSAVPLEENLRIAEELLAESAKARTILEIEIGVVGGEEDGVVGEAGDKLYSTPEDALRVAEVLGVGERGRYLLAATFGNVHGVYQPGHVKL